MSDIHKCILTKTMLSSLFKNSFGYHDTTGYLIPTSSTKYLILLCVGESVVKFTSFKVGQGCCKPAAGLLQACFCPTNSNTNVVTDKWAPLTTKKFSCRILFLAFKTIFNHDLSW